MSQSTLFQSAGVGAGKANGRDEFYTPDHLALALVMESKSHGPFALEPSVGGGAWVRALRRAREGLPGVVWGCDTNHQAPGLSACDKGFVADFRALNMGSNIRPKLIIGNPPYNQAIEHVQRALLLSQERVALLLRITFLASQERLAQLWSAESQKRLMRLDQVIILPERPSFTGDGQTDSADSAFFIWDVNNPFSRPPVISWLDPAAVAAAKAWIATGERPARWPVPYRPPAGHIDDPRGRHG